MGCALLLLVAQLPSSLGEQAGSKQQLTTLEWNPGKTSRLSCNGFAMSGNQLNLVLKAQDIPPGKQMSSENSGSDESVGAVCAAQLASPLTAAELALIGSPLHPINSTLPATPSNETLALCAEHGSPLPLRRLLFASALHLPMGPFLCSSSEAEIGSWVAALGTPTASSPVRISRQVEQASTIASLIRVGTTLAVCHSRSTEPKTYSCHDHHPDEHDELFELRDADGSISYAICHEHDKKASGTGELNATASSSPKQSSCLGACLGASFISSVCSSCAFGVRCSLRLTGGCAIGLGNLGLTGTAAGAPTPPRGVHCHPLKTGDLVFLDSRFDYQRDTQTSSS